MKFKIAWWRAVPREERDVQRVKRIMAVLRIGASPTPEDTKWVDDHTCWAFTFGNDGMHTLSDVRKGSYKYSRSDWWARSQGEYDLEEI